MGLAEFEKFIQTDGRPNEIFSFVSRQELLATAKERFAKSLEGQQRLGAIFITESGSPTEKLLGLLTPWDVLPH